MKNVSIDTLRSVADGLLFDMSEEEYETLLSEFGVLMKQMEVLSNAEGLEEMEPMTFPFDCECEDLREDEPCVPLTREEVLRNAGNVEAGQIKIPKVVG